jgi:hypothetical protein
MSTLKKRETFKSRGRSFKNRTGSPFEFTDDKPLDGLDDPMYRICFSDGVIIYAYKNEVYETVE